MREHEPVFVRFQSSTPDDRGRRLGVFALVNRLGRDGVLTPDQHTAWRTGNAWFDAAYTTPTGVYDDAVNPGAHAWFKASAVHLVERTEQHVELLRAHGVAFERLESDDPGRVVYEDDEQVVVVPR